MIIDFHTHTFPDKIALSTVNKLGAASRTVHFTDGTVSGLRASMDKGGIDISVNLPVLTSPAQVEKVNSAMTARNDELRSMGIVAFGGMHPDHADVKRELRRLKENGIPGIKIHPAYQNTDIDDIKMLRIIDCASELGLIVVTHAGIDISIYDHDFASAAAVLNVIEQVHPEKFVLAHMGGWARWHDVERYIAGAPVWLDTAFSIGKITADAAAEGKPYISENLSDEDFTRIVRKHGVKRVLFASDSPWEDQKDYVSRVAGSGLTEEELELVFYRNAADILQPCKTDIKGIQ